MVGQGGGLVFVDTVSGSSVTTINVGDTVTWTWSGTMSHGIQSGNCTGNGGGGGGYVIEGYGGGGCTPSSDFQSGTHAPPYQYSQTFTTAGSFPYYCTVHESAMKGRVVVNPPGNAIASNRKRRAY
jgi:plastocyanin